MQQTVLQMINNYMSKYNWNIIQAEYNSGLSLRDLIKKYGMSSKTLTVAVRKGNLSTRSKSDAAKLDAIKNPLVHTKEFKEQQRVNIIKRYETGWMPKSGRCKKFRYVSPIAGTVLLDGTWELGVAIWLDNQEFKWKRNTKRFQYINLKGQLSHYTPDFFVEELGGYLEIKGYETALDRCKWSQFTDPLVIWKKKELKNIGVVP